VIALIGDGLLRRHGDSVMPTRAILRYVALDIRQPEQWLGGVPRVADRGARNGGELVQYSAPWTP
jgi:hypothetical protein